MLLKMTSLYSSTVLLLLLFVALERLLAFIIAVVALFSVRVSWVCFVPRKGFAANSSIDLSQHD